MSIVIAIPTNPLFAPLVANADRVAKEIGARIIRGTEQECHGYLGRHIADVALVTPLGYAQESLKTDLRILPVSALTLDALTYIGSMYLHQNASSDTFERCASPHAQDFLMQMGVGVLSEKFDMELQFEQVQGSVAELLAKYDAVLDYGFDAAQSVALDISDEWSDYFGEILPLALWVCRPEEVPEEIADIVEQFRDAEISLRQEITEIEHNGTSAYRNGVLSFEWTEETEEALQHTIELLYYWQYVPRVAATKLWGRDVVERV
ncbi:MAG: hypothetical protein MUF71_00940 [Candidatus Kapabacteria bacterium]|jgi:hypothetical protein|nr:hypothetical protein [Candidatus Kapabacteria bacterium]